MLPKRGPKFYLEKARMLTECDDISVNYKVALALNNNDNKNEKEMIKKENENEKENMMKDTQLKLDYLNAVHADSLSTISQRSILVCQYFPNNEFM